MENEKQIKNEDEISLLDLFTVLVRYRKLIIGISVFSIVLAFTGYFFYPEYQYKEAQSGKQIQGIMNMEIAPKAAPYVSQSLDNFILSSDIIYDALHMAGMEYFEYSGEKLSMADESDKKIIMYLINQLWIKNLDLAGNRLVPEGKEHNKTFSVRKIGSGTSTTAVTEVTYKNKDAELVKKFFDSLFALSAAKVEDNMRINAQIMVGNYERIASLSKISESMQIILEKDFDTYIFLRDFLDGKENAVKLVGEPVFVETVALLMEYKDSYPKTGVITALAGIFIAVLIAFALNVIRTVKNDEEAMQKIRDALGDSGSK
jgi:hypothetical protein